MKTIADESADHVTICCFEATCGATVAASSVLTGGIDTCISDRTTDAVKSLRLARMVPEGVEVLAGRLVGFPQSSCGAFGSPRSSV